MNESDNIRSDFWITDEDGNDFHLDLLGFADYEKKVYVLCAPASSNESGEGARAGTKKAPKVAIFNLTYVNEQPQFTPVADRELCEKIFGIYSDRVIEDQLKNT
ncbi:MAG: DUF1292 domain-containing protein [Clostridia bacterium]|nr:DUF1292 domain-containing protein [Clostridia bacterium]